MADHSAIEWTDATWNPTTGCTKVSPGCANCYIVRTPAFRIKGRQFVKGATDLQLHPDRLDQPLRWRKPRRVFVNSLSDLFHEDVPDAFIDQVFAVMALSSQHTFQVLTKRPERMRAYFDNVTQIRDGAITHERVQRAIETIVLDEASPLTKFQRMQVRQRVAAWNAVCSWPLPNVWLGPSVENQHWADHRFPIACELGEAGWRVMVSMEPLLGPVTIPQRFLALGQKAWVIPGGESGAGARPCEVAWVRSIVQQCQAAGVPVFVKQLGAKPFDWNDTEPTGRFRTDPATGRRQLEVVARRIVSDRKGGLMSEWPADLRVREFPAGPA